MTGRPPDLVPFADDLGPAKTVHVHEPTRGLAGRFSVF
jgi:hypothetical protein